MNYLAHGYRFLDSPEFVAGTAIPDWLRVASPRIRARARLVDAALPVTPDGPERILLQGIRQHHRDDDTFHSSILFQQICETLAGKFRKQMPDPYDHRPGLLGHIVTELLLDNELATRDTELLPRYYAVLANLDPEWIQTTVNTIVYRPAERLAEFIRIFHELQFLYDYADNNRLMMRLNQVLSRAELRPLTSTVFPVFEEGRELLRRQADLLLPPAVESFS